ncbi:MAG: GTP cyclohydrolase I FolE [Wigglesworthia glossinidia]|nr:GTP cyclohydrolase I FolE [Wigglesworthia glossinidia]
MSKFTKEAMQVKNALISKGLETPFSNYMKNKKNKKILITTYIKKIMKILNLNLDNDSLSQTPSRIARMYVEEIFSGLDYMNFPKITVIKNTKEINEMITMNNIILHSICEHHFLIFEGRATVAYVPKKFLIGLSKINRIVNFFSKRPQIQERLTHQILIALQILLNTNNVAVSIIARHFCVQARGVRDSESNAQTLACGGVFQNKSNLRNEFLQITNNIKF